MKRYIALLLVLLLCLGGCGAPVDEKPADTNTDAPASTQEISCLSFNILSYNTGGQTFDSPEERAKRIIPFILETDADIVGLQEVDTVQSFNWLDAIKKGLSDKYEIRAIGEELEYGAKQMNIAAGLVILYRKGRFELENSGCTYYWEDYNRYYQWVKLKDKAANKELYVTNTHMSINPMAADGVNRDIEMGEFLRSSEAEELVTFWEETVGEAPLFATGDYNAKIDAKPHTEYLMRGGVYQPSVDAAIDSDGCSTVDFCYVNTSAMDVEKYEMMQNYYMDKDGDFMDMSDHNPVITYAVYK